MVDRQLIGGWANNRIDVLLQKGSVVMTESSTGTTGAAEVTPAIALRLAAVEVERRGLAKGSYFDSADRKNCKVCSMGAISWVLGGGESYGAVFEQPASQVLAAYLGARGDEYGTAFDVISYWNDAPGRTAAEVVAAMVAAADDWDSRNAAVSTS